MKYAHEVMGLMRPYPGLRFKLIEIVRYVSGNETPTAKEWERIRKSIRRLLDELEEMGSIHRNEPAAGLGGYANYEWKPGHEVIANRDVNRENTSGALRP